MSLGRRVVAAALVATLAVEGFGPAATRALAEEVAAEDVAAQQMAGEGLQVVDESAEGADAGTEDTVTIGAAEDGDVSDAAIEVADTEAAAGGSSSADKPADAGDGVAVLPGTAGEPVSLAATNNKEWVSFVDWNGNSNSCKPVEVFEGTISESRSLYGYYFVKSDTTFKQRLRINGWAIIIIADGATLECPQGISVNYQCDLTVLGQAGGTGRLKATASKTSVKVQRKNDERPHNEDYYNAAIGSDGSRACGAIKLGGITVDATGNSDAPAIGSGDNTGGGTLAIKRACVSAHVGDKYAPAIGCGHHSTTFGRITIEDSEVTATSEGSAAGIGGFDGGFGNNGANGGEVVIRNSHVTASTKGKGSAIGGGGAGGAFDAGAGGKVWIEGDSVVDASSGRGAAIGRGYYDNDGVGEVHFDDRLSVTDLSENVGKVASAGEREGYCRYRNHVRIEPCQHKGATWSPDGPKGHAMACSHCLKTETRPHGRDAAGRCVVCGYEHEDPAFTDVTLAHGGRLGLTFWLQLPQGHDCDGAYVELSVAGKSPRTLRIALADAEAGESGLRGFEMPLSAVEMAEGVTATFHGADGETCARSSSMKGAIRSANWYTDMARNLPIVGRRMKWGLTHATANLGHCLQAWLSKERGWVPGVDYADMDLSYAKANDVAAAREGLAAYAPRGGAGLPYNNRMTCSLTFGPTTTMDICIESRDGVRNGHAHATLGGRTFRAERLSDGRQRIRIEGICATDLDEEVELQCALTDERGFDVQTIRRLSPLSVARAAMASGKLGEEGEAAYAAIYWYWRAAEGL